MPNQYKNKVVFFGDTLIDITDTTATADKVLEGYTFYGANGQKLTGSATGGGVVIEDTLDSHGGTIRTITTQNVTTLGPKSITSNGTYDPEDDNLDGYSEVVVSIDVGSGAYTRTEICPSQTFTPSSSNKRATLTGMTTGFVDQAYYIVTYDNVEWITTCDILWSVDYCIGEAQFFLNTGNVDSACPFGVVWESGTTATIAVGDTSQHTIKIERLVFTQDPEVTLVTKSISTNGTYNASSDSADGYNQVTVNVPTGTARSSSDLTVSGATVTAPAGLYSSSASKSVASGTVTAPSSISGTSATVSTGTNTLTLSKTVSVTPSVTTAGYVSSGTAGNSSVSLTASVTTKGATTYNTSSTDQTIASGTYLTGTQTIRGVTTSNLTAENIKSGVVVTVGDSADADRVLSVTGTYSGGGGSSKAIYMYKGLASRTANSYGSTNATVTVTKAGTYTISYVAIRGSSSGTMGTNLHIGSTTGTNQQTWNNGTYGQYVTLTNQTISANTAVTIYATSGSNSRTIYVGQLIVEEQ